MHRKRIHFFCLALTFLVVGSCGGSSSDNSDSVSETSQQSLLLTEEEEMLYTNNVMQRSISDGAEYGFGKMTPVFSASDNGNVKVSWVYDDPNVKGGSPEATVSRTTGEIVRIIYTR